MVFSLQSIESSELSLAEIWKLFNTKIVLINSVITKKGWARRPILCVA